MATKVYLEGARIMKRKAVWPRREEMQLLEIMQEAEKGRGKYPGFCLLSFYTLHQ